MADPSQVSVSFGAVVLPSVQQAVDNTKGAVADVAEAVQQSHAQIGDANQSASASFLKVGQAAQSAAQSRAKAVGKAGEGQDRDLSDRDQQLAQAGQDGAMNGGEVLAARVAINAAIVANDTQTQNRLRQLAVESAQAQRSVANLSEQDRTKIDADEVAAVKSADDRITEIEAQGEARRRKLVADSAKAQAAAYRQNVASIVDTMGRGFMGMARGTQGFQKTMIQVAESIENIWLRAVEKLVVNWITGEGTKTAETQAAAAARGATEQAAAQQSVLTNMEATLKQISQNAANAATGASAAVAKIPFVGPLLAPEAGAATYAAVMAFGTLASASGGYDIGNENPLTQLHAREMVLPASIASPLRDMIAANANEAPGAGRGGGSRGGDTYHMAFQSLDSRSVRRMMDNPGTVRAAAAAGRRHG